MQYITPLLWAGLVLFGSISTYAQTPTPAEQGGSAKRNWNPHKNANFYRYDFVKFHPDYTPSDPTAERICSTVEVEEQRNLFFANTQNQSFEKWLKTQIKEEELYVSKSIYFKIPVVVHVIYSNPLENISDEQILSQIKILNADYQRQNPDTVQTHERFQPITADLNLEFVLATRTPTNEPTTGIERISISGSPFSETFVNNIIKPNTIWNPEEYLNLWVCNLGDKVLGFSQFPESSGLTGLPEDVGSANTDGVVIHYTAFGTTGVLTAPFHKGRTATHEIGHWLGLRHIWGDGGCEVDDFCGDTPSTGSPNSGCNRNKMGCEQPAMIENYMDYTNDSCMNSFTLDQRARVHAVLKNSPRRKKLPFSDGLKPFEEPPHPTFTADVKMGIAPLEVMFTDLTPSQPAQRKWAFPGGFPQTSAENSLKISYLQAGSYTVSLALTNRFGTDNRPMTHYIHVFDKGTPLPYKVDFEQDLATLEKNKILFVQETQHHNWQHFVGTGGFGTSAGAILANHYTQNKIGAKAVFMLPVLDFTTGIEAQLQFDLAYRHYNASYGDTLAVYLSTDGGKKYEAIYYKYGAQLSRNRATEQVFQPLPADWMTEKIDLRAYDKFDKVMIAFVSYSGNGNQLFLDNIQVNSAPLPLPEIDFQALKREVCEGEELQFTDKTRFRPQEWLWSFPGAEPSADSTQNPKVRYQTAGIYEVLLTAKNTSGETSGIKKAYITVKPSPKIEIVGNKNPVCPQTLVSLSATGAINWQWHYGDKKQNGNLFKDTLFYTTTLQLVGTGNNGCTSTETITIPVKDEQVVKVVPYAANLCKGESVQLTAMGGVNYQWMGNGITQPQVAKQNLQPQKDESYQVSVQTANGCTFRKTIPVTVHPLPELSIQTPKTTICRGESIRLTAQGAISYHWKEAMISGKTLSISPSTHQSYELIGINEYGCSDSIVQTIKVEQPPILSSSPSNLALCSGENKSVQLKGASTYQWYAADKTESGTTSSQFTLSPPKTQIYTVIGKSEKGCSDTLKLPVEVLPTPVLVVNADKYAVCKGQTVTLSATGATAYQWKSSAGKSWSSASLIDQPAQTTTYTVSGKDASGCTSQPLQVEVATLSPTAPIANFELLNKGKICAGDALLFAATSSNAQQYEWEFPGGEPAFSNQPHPEVHYKKGGVYTVYLRVTNCEGETDEVQKQDFVTIEDVPPIQLISDKERICEGEQVKLKAETLLFSQIEWKAPNLTLSGAEINFLAEKTTHFEVKTRFQNGCTRKTDYTLAVTSVSEPLRITPENHTICEGDSLTLTVENGNLVTWKSLLTGKISKGKTLNILPKQSQIYEVSAQNLEGCPIQKELPITILPKPVLSIEPAMTLLCKGSSETLKASGAVAYQWSPEIGLSNFAGKEVIATPLITQSYTLTGISENGCKATLTTTVGVSDMPPLTLKADDLSICKGSATRLIAEGAETYNWKPQSEIIENQGNEIIVRPNYTTTYQVEGIGTDGCSSKKSLTLTVHDFEPLKVIPLAPVLCLGDSVQLEVQAVYNNLRWGEGIPIRQSKQKKVWAKPTESRLYQVQAWDENGCNRTGSVTVVVKLPEPARISAARSIICEGEQITLEASGGKEYQWLSAKGIAQQNGNKLVVSPEKKEVYRVVTKDSQGCKDTASFDIAARLLVPRVNLSQWEFDLANENGVVEFRDSTTFATTWDWDFGDGAKAKGKIVKHLYAQPDTYTVTLTVGNGICTKTKTRQVRVSNSSDLGILEYKNNLKLNHNSDLLTLSFQLPTDMTFQASLLNSQKDELLSGIIRGKQGDNQHEIDISNLEKGIYYLKISTHNRQLLRKVEKL